MALAVGSRIGQYEVLLPIGAGGMGEVYRARDRRLRRLIKCRRTLELCEAEVEHLDAQTMSVGPVTSIGHVIGTAAYMSEQAPRVARVDHRSDLFSFGILLYEMATGVRPFTGDLGRTRAADILVGAEENRVNSPGSVRT